MKKVAILIDGGFLSSIVKNKCHRHLTPDDITLLSQNLIIPANGEELFRIYYYDASPYAGIQTKPGSATSIDFSKLKVFTAIESFHRDLAEKNLLAVRKGRLAFRGWKISAFGEEKISKKLPLTESDLKPDFVQKAVDMKIGLDIAWMSMKRIVDKLILVTADNDFVPAMKFARKEGLLVSIANIQDLTSEMRQHVDEVINIDIHLIIKP